jgi:Spy/CpxP family protein refolding chaperone
LNGYPGPLHVIELADPLALTPDQLDGTRKLMEAHRSRARTFGAELVAAERDLDRLFKARNADAARVSAAAQRIGAIQARLRAEHLNTHLAQTKLLNAEQVRRYSELRGYSTGSAQGSGLPHGHSKSTHSATH